MTIFTVAPDLATISEMTARALAQDGFVSEHVSLNGGCKRLLTVSETVQPIGVIHLGDAPAVTLDWVRGFLATRPDFVIIAYVPAPIRAPEVVAELIQSGAWCFFERNATALAKILRRIGDSALPSHLIAQIVAYMPSAVQSVLRDIAQATRRPLSVGDLAE